MSLDTYFCFKDDSRKGKFLNQMKRAFNNETSSMMAFKTDEMLTLVFGLVSMIFQFSFPAPVKNYQTQIKTYLLINK